jgi:hypothetical protein
VLDLDTGTVPYPGKSAALMGLKTMPGSSVPQAFQRDPKTLCARQEVAYRCSAGHDFTLTFAAEVEPPGIFTCRCGREGHQGDTPSEADRARVRRDEHMARVFERRTIAELEELLTERLAIVTATRSLIQPEQETVNA